MQMISVFVPPVKLPPERVGHKIYSRVTADSKECDWNIFNYRVVKILTMLIWSDIFNDIIFVENLHMWWY